MPGLVEYKHYYVSEDVDFNGKYKLYFFDGEDEHAPMSLPGLTSLGKPHPNCEHAMIHAERITGAPGNVDGCYPYSDYLASTITRSHSDSLNHTEREEVLKTYQALIAIAMVADTDAVTTALTDAGIERLCEARAAIRNLGDQFSALQKVSLDMSASDEIIQAQEKTLQLMVSAEKLKVIVEAIGKIKDSLLVHDKGPKSNNFLFSMLKGDISSEQYDLINSVWEQSKASISNNTAQELGKFLEVLQKVAIDIKSEAEQSWTDTKKLIDSKAA